MCGKFESFEMVGCDVCEQLENLNNSPLAGCAVRTETYDFVADQWTDQADYPFAE